MKCLCPCSAHLDVRCLVQKQGFWLRRSPAGLVGGGVRPALQGALQGPGSGSSSKQSAPLPAWPLARARVVGVRG